MAIAVTDPIQYLENVYSSPESRDRLGRYRETLMDAIDLYGTGDPEKLRKLREVIMFTIQYPTPRLTVKKIDNIKEVVGVIDMFINHLERERSPEKKKTSHLSIVK
ncbi:hypothetical protein [Alkalicoccobacillus gibsonii]|uniref:hypothetical protein n=1 Tax=Alkalicoccobacillus gibsonii TaxID=79881 RepID=UPI0035120898